MRPFLFLPARPLWIARISGAAVMLTGVLVLTGWMTGSTLLVRVCADWSAMVPLTAAMFCAAGAALLAIMVAMERVGAGQPERGDCWRTTATGLAVVVAVIGGVRFCFHLLGRSSGVDMLGFDPGTAVGQMAPMTAGAFLLAGCALGLAARREFSKFAQWLAGLVILVGLSGFTRHLYGGALEYFHLRMAMHTAWGLAVLGLGIFYVRPDGGFMVLWASDTAGGVLVRRLFPVAVVVPVAVGWLRLQGQKAGWYGTEVGLTIFAMANVLIFTVLTWHTAGKLRDADMRRRKSEDARTRYVSIVESSGDAIIGKTLEGVITSWNPAAETLFGYAEAEVLGRSMLILFPPDRLAEEEEILGRLRRGERIRNYETVRVHKNGRRIDVSVTVSPLKDERGGIVGASKICHDIGERKRAERTLLRERNFSGAAIDSMPGIFYLFDAKGRFLRWNRNFEQVSGYSAAEIAGMHPLDFFAGEDKARVAARIAEVLDAGESDVEADFVSKDGRATPYYFTGLRTTLDDETCLVGVGLDITARKRAEAEAGLLTQRLKHAMDAAGIGVWDWDIKSDNWYATEMYFTMLGYDPGEGFCSRDVWIERLHPEDREMVVAKIKAIMAGANTPYFYQARIRHADGSYRWVQVVGRVLVTDAAGRPTRMIGARLDITENKRAEAKIHELNTQLEQRVAERTAQLEAANLELERSRATFVNLFESLPGLYLVLTPDLKIVTASDAYTEATMTTRAGLIGRGLFEVFPDNPDDPTATGVANLKASFDRVRRSAAPDTMAIQKYDVRGPDGVFEEHYWSPINSPVFGVDRRIEYIIHRVENVTDFVKQKSRLASIPDALQVRMEQMEAEIFQSSQKMQAANQQLEAANKELEAFSYSVSHDLRAPLRTVDGYSQAVLEDFGAQLPDEGRRYLATIRKGAQQMGALIDDLLRFARLSRATMQVEQVDMGRLVRTALVDLHFDTGDARVELRLEDLPACQGDPALLRQVWMNLLSNALKYSGRREKAVIEIGTKREGADCVYFVRDNGAGFDMRYAGKLFGVFQRLHRAEDYEGTGVGLAIVQRIVHRHGGRIWAEAQENQGAIFYFTVEQKKLS